MNKAIIDITGKVFGRLRVLKFSHINTDRKACWLCLCECGKRVTVVGKNMRKGNARSCGCLREEHTIKSNTRHGLTSKGMDLKLYNVWSKMKERCNNIQDKGYKNYGGRGIKVCPEWMTDFKRFIFYLKNPLLLNNKAASSLSIQRYFINVLSFR